MIRDCSGFYTRTCFFGYEPSESKSNMDFCFRSGSPKNIRTRTRTRILGSLFYDIKMRHKINYLEPSILFILISLNLSLSSTFSSLFLFSQTLLSSFFISVHRECLILYFSFFFLSSCNLSLFVAIMFRFRTFLYLFLYRL